MKTTITARLKTIEAQYNIRILFACESGSRGWEFPSPDSDYDVRFIYIRPLSYYLSVKEREDSLAFPINDELDLNGWDLRKVLQLMQRSNTTAFEWLQSPIVYQEDKDFRDALWLLCQDYFSRRSNIYHYLGITKGALETMSEDKEIKIKKLFYVLRPLLAAIWCVERKSIAPMSIKPLMALMPAALQQEVQNLIAIKAGAAEGQLVTIPEALKKWIDERYADCLEKAAGLDKNVFTEIPLDEFFRKTLAQ